MIVYHRTSTESASAILSNGFRDARGSYLTLNEYEGVWVANTPLSVSDGIDGDALLRLDMPEAELVPYEWVEDGKPYREFLVPAEIVNRYPVVLTNEDDE